MSADLCKISVYIGDVTEPVQWLIIPEVDIPPIALFHSMMRTFAPMRPAITAAAVPAGPEPATMTSYSPEIGSSFAFS